MSEILNWVNLANCHAKLHSDERQKVDDGTLKKTICKIEMGMTYAIPVLKIDHPEKTESQFLVTLVRLYSGWVEHMDELRSHLENDTHLFFPTHIIGEPEEKRMRTLSGQFSCILTLEARQWWFEIFARVRMVQFYSSFLKEVHLRAKLYFIFPVSTDV